MAGGSRFRVTPAAAPEQPEIKQLQNVLLVPPPLPRGGGGRARGSVAGGGESCLNALARSSRWLAKGNGHLQ